MYMEFIEKELYALVLNKDPSNECSHRRRNGFQG